MKAIKLSTPGGIENLVPFETEIPEIRDNEVLVKVKAISINPVDVKARAYEGVLSWIFQDLRPVILGWDISGTVAAAGNSVTDLKTGDNVFGMVNFIGHGKAYAEYIAVPSGQLSLKPENISHEEAAGATLAALTALQALKTLNITNGQKILIHGAAGGVGHYAVQLAKHAGAYVIATSSERNREFLLNLGVDEHIDYQKDKFEERLRDVDYVLDTIGSENFDRSLKVLKKGGRIITIPSPLTDDKIKLAESMGVHAGFILVQSSGLDMKEIAGLLKNGIVKSNVEAIYSFDKIGEAHLHVETGRTRGKVIVKV
jgi:NADPH:quinone reductase-like Zn-dependent oxidoreductase